MAMATYEWEGNVKWCKVLGEPREMYDPTKGNEWSTVITVTKEAKQALKGYKVLNHFKIDDETDQQFLTIRKAELTKNGQKNKPVIVVNEMGEPWDQSKLIGNGSLVKAKVSLAPFKRDGVEHHKVTLEKITVLHHVEPPAQGAKTAKPVKVDNNDWQEDVD